MTGLIGVLWLGFRRCTAGPPYGSLKSYGGLTPHLVGCFPKGFQYLSVLDLYKGLKILPKHCTNAGKSSDCLDKRKLICGNLTNMTLYNSTLTRFALVPLQDKFQQQILHMS